MNDDNHQIAEDDPRDAHLLAALRHAPDRDAVPPREVSARILAAARAAVQSASETRTPWWQRLSAWLVQPQVAASFGTLVVASLVGVMWSTREAPVAEFVPSPPAVGRAEQAPVAQVPAAAPPVDAAKAEASGTVGASAANREAREVPDARDALAVAPPPKPAPRRDAAARADQRSRAVAEASPATAKTAAPEATAAAAAAPPPPAAPQVADAAAPAAAAERRLANESDLQVMARQQGAAASRAAPAAMSGMLLADKSRAAEPLAGIDAALAAGARWQASGRAGERQHGEAQRAFWASVKEATQGRWAAVQPISLPAPWLVLEGSPGAILWIMNGALYITAQGQSWRVPVDAARLADWQREVARW